MKDMLSMLKVPLLVVVVLLLVSSCLPDPEVVTPEQVLAQQLSAIDKTQLTADVKEIDDSLAAWNITAAKDPFGGVRYVVTTQGTGKKPSLSNVIKAKYQGKLFKTGVVFTKPTDTLQLALYNLIVGWQTTLPQIQAGSKVTMYVPSQYGYGSRDIRDQSTNAIIIPKNSNLIFEIELLEVKD